MGREIVKPHQKGIVKAVDIKGDAPFKIVQIKSEIFLIRLEPDCKTLALTLARTGTYKALTNLI